MQTRGFWSGIYLECEERRLRLQGSFQPHQFPDLLTGWKTCLWRRRCYTFGAAVLRYVFTELRIMISMWFNEIQIPEWNGGVLYDLQAETTGIRRSHQRLASEWAMVSGIQMYLRKSRGEKNGNGQQRKVTKSGRTKTKLKFRQCVSLRSLWFP